MAPDPTATSSGQRSAATRERILAAATEVFSEAGYADASLREVALAADLTKQAIYYHYASKDDILTAIVDPLLNRLEEVLNEHGVAHNADDQRQLLTAYFEMLLEHRPVVALVARDRTAVTHRDLESRLDAHLQRARAAVAGPRPSRYRTVRAAAALACLWRPLTTLTDHIPERTLRQALLDAAVAAAQPPTANDS